MKIIYTLAIALVIGLIGYNFATLRYVEKLQTFELGASINNNVPTVYVASTTAFTLTTSSQRLLGTSTPTRRLGAVVQPINCTNAGTVFLRADRDIAATANAGIAVLASTTLQYEDYPGLTVPQGSVQGILSTGTCTVIVTEYRAQY